MLDAPRFTNLGGAVGAAGFLDILPENAGILPTSDMTGIIEIGSLEETDPGSRDSGLLRLSRVFDRGYISETVAVDDPSLTYSMHKGVTRLPEIPDAPSLRGRGNQQIGRPAYVFLRKPHPERGIRHESI